MEVSKKMFIMSWWIIVCLKTLTLAVSIYSHLVHFSGNAGCSSTLNWNHTLLKWRIIPENFYNARLFCQSTLAYRKRERQSCCRRGKKIKAQKKIAQFPCLCLRQFRIIGFSAAFGCVCNASVLPKHSSTFFCLFTREMSVSCPLESQTSLPCAP